MDTESGLLTVDDVVARRYRIQSIVGASDEAMTYRAMDLTCGSPLALTVATPESFDAAGADRFLRVGRLLGELTNPHVAHVQAGGLLESGAPFLVTEWLEGCSLATLMHDTTLPLEVAVDYVLQAGEGLAEMHARGMVHRNLDPKKLFLVRDDYGKPCVKLLGCGAAKVGADGGGLKPGATFVGHAAYRSPEELALGSVDRRADVWSLGVILFQLVTGSLPFGDGDASEVLRAIRRSTFPNASDLDGRVPRAFDRVMKHCLRWRRAGRILQVRSLASALAPFGGEEAGQELARIRDVARTASLEPPAMLKTLRPQTVRTSTHGPPPARPVPLVKRKRMSRWIPAAALTSLLLAGVGAVRWNHEAPVALAAVTEQAARIAARPPPMIARDLRVASESPPPPPAPPETSELPLTGTVITVLPAPIRATPVPVPPRASPPSTPPKRHPHPRLSTTVFPEGPPPPELFDSRK